MKPHQLYKFGSFCLDATAKVLLKADQPVTITRKSVETLLVLVENAGQVVSKEELLSAIWPDRVVDEANLTQNIAMVRRALAAERGSAAFIETFPGRGYRLVGPVVVEEPEAFNGNLTTEAAVYQLAANGQPEPASFAMPETALAESSAPPVVRSRTGLRLIAIVASVVAVSAIGWILLQRKSSQPETEFHVAPLTRLPGKEWQPALSPDGKRVAFLWEQGDGQSPSLRVQAADGQAGAESSPRRIARADGHYSSPAWSPDGSALAFLRIGRDSTDVLTASLETGDERLIARFTPPGYGLQRRLLDWSPDGQLLVVSHSEAADKPNGLYLVSVATGEKRRLTEPQAMVGGDLDPRFSPDSRTITFIRDIHRSNQELYSVAVAGGQSKQLTADAKQISGHDWMASGRQIIIASDRGGEFRLWRMNADAASSEKNPQPLGIYGEYPIELSLARKNDSLVYSVQQQDRNIWRLDLKDKRWTRVIASSAQDASPQYSPAGDKICFRSDRSGEEQLWVSDADGANQKQITKAALYPSVGHWSPDGRRIAFNNARTGELHIASLIEDGSWRVQGFSAEKGAGGVHPVFSPDGKWLYAGTTNSILRFPAGGGSGTEVVKIGGFSLGVSADGKFVYFMREVNDTVLWKVNTDTGELSKAVDGLVQRCTSCWSLSPEGIYFLGISRESFDAQVVYFHDFVTGRRRELLKYPEPLSPVGSGPFSLSPDLRSLLCVRVDPSNSDILRVEPFR